jgi:two-component system NtrC family sensor kinase
MTPVPRVAGQPLPTPLVSAVAGSDLTTGTGSAPRLDVEQVRQILPQLIDSLSDAVLVVGRDRRVVAANRRYVEVFGVAGAVVGSLCHEALNCAEARRDGKDAACAACEVIERRQPRRLLRTLPDVSGSQRRWEATLNPVLDDAGEVTHVVEVWRDITDRSRLESQLSHSERLASLGMLAAGVGHEINNPLASVLTGVESLQRWLARTGLAPGSREEVSEVLEVLEREVRRCRETTDKLMLLAQPYSVAPSWVDLNQAVLDTLSLLRYQMRKQSVLSVVDLDPELPAVWAKDGGMRGVCMNLMMNAVQAMRQGGTLTVRTRRDGSRVTIAVEDTGPGIAPEHLDRIWDPFFTTKPTGHGTGLGLSITQGIVARHGGSAQVESRPGEGALFVVSLPISGPGGQGA